MSQYPGPQSATVSRVATSTAAATLFAATGAAANRLIFNEAAAVLYVKFGASASATDYTVQVAAGGYYEAPEPTYSGIITGILASGTGQAQCTSY
jgi:hypothetical protein